MRTHDQLLATIHRFQHGFWQRGGGGRPPVGIYDEGIYLPINFLRQPYTRSTVNPEDVTGDLVASEYEFSFARRRVSCDDFIAFAAPWRGIPWLEAACGCPVRYSEGSLAPGHFVSSAEELGQLPISASDEWLDCLRRETQRLAAEAAPDCWISPSILRGPSDALAAMRGMTEFFLDLYDSPHIVAGAANRANQVLMKEIETHYSVVPPKLGGYGHIFGYWAPGKTITIQEDALGMCSPGVYREIFMPLNTAVVEQLGQHVFFHLHSTGCRHYADVMNVPGLAGLELTLETVGPTLRDLAPMCREILERTRLILHVATGFEFLPEILSTLPREGLYLVIPDKFIPTDTAYRDFIGAHWPQ